MVRCRSVGLQRKGLIACSNSVLNEETRILVVNLKYKIRHALLYTFTYLTQLSSMIQQDGFFFCYIFYFDSTLFFGWFFTSWMGSSLNPSWFTLLMVPQWGRTSQRGFSFLLGLFEIAYIYCILYILSNLTEVTKKWNIRSYTNAFFIQLMLNLWFMF